MLIIVNISLNKHTKICICHTHKLYVNIITTILFKNSHVIVIVLMGPGCYGY